MVSPAEVQISQPSDQARATRVSRRLTDTWHIDIATHTYSVLCIAPTLHVYFALGAGQLLAACNNNNNHYLYGI